MATATRKIDVDGHSTVWHVRDDLGGRYGPVDLETLKGWVRDGRVGPANEVSSDGDEWAPATSLGGLEMDWVAEVTPGRFYGPIHRGAMQELVKDGSIAGPSALFRRSAIDADDQRARETCVRLERELKAALDQAAEWEQACLQARRLAETHDAGLQRTRRALEAQVQEASERLKREQRTAGDALQLARAQADALEARLKQLGAKCDADATRFEEQNAAWQARVDALQGEKRAMELERQTFQAEAARALSEAAARARRSAQVEADLLETAQQRDALKAEAAAARAVLEEQRRLGEQARARCAALEMAAEASRRESDEVRGRLAQAARELETARLEAERLRRAAPPPPPREVLEAEVLPPARREERRRPEPETAAPFDKPPADVSGRNGKPGPSLADLERQARLELERLGAQGPRFFARKR